MNILFHGWEYPPVSAGVGSYMRSMGRVLADAGHHVVVVAGRVEGLPEEEEHGGVTIYRAYGRDEVGSVRVRDMVLALARQHSINLIEGADHLGDCAGVLKCTNRPPVLIKLHTCNVLRVPVDAQIFYGWQRLTVALAMARKKREIQGERYCIEHADLLCAPSKRILEEAHKQGLKLPPSVACIPNPVFPLSCDTEKVADVPTVLFAGRLDIGKGVQYLAPILKRLLQECPEVILEIAGDDTYARWLGSIKDWMIYRFGSIVNNVRFLGRLSEKELDAAYRRAWAVIVPSRWDNFPTVVLEAMARSKAIVASSNGGMPEMLKDTSCSVADPASPEFAAKILRFVKDAALRQRAGESAKNKVKREYSPDVVARQYLDFVQTVL